VVKPAAACADLKNGLLNAEIGGSLAPNLRVSRA